VKIQSSTIVQEPGHNAPLRLLATRMALLSVDESTFIFQNGHARTLGIAGSTMMHKFSCCTLDADSCEVSAL